MGWTIAAVISMTTAVLAVIISGYNTWLMVQKSKVKLKIGASVSVPVDSMAYVSFSLKALKKLSSQEKQHVREYGRICLDIVNLSEFVIDIAEIGIAVDKKSIKRRVAIITPQSFDCPNHIKLTINNEIKYPIKLHSREAIKVMAPPENLYYALTINARYAYVHTSCGKKNVGNIKEIINFLAT